MSKSVLLTPEVIINPLHLATNLLIYTGECDKIFVPVASLYWKLCNDYTILQLADIIPYSSSDPKRGDYPLFVEGNNIENLASVTAILSLAHEIGIVEAILDEEDKWLLDKGEHIFGNWCDTILGEIFSTFRVIETIHKSEVDNTVNISIEITAKKFGLNRNKIKNIIRRYEVPWSQRNLTEYEYAIYMKYLENFSNSKTILSALKNRYFVSTPNKSLTKFLRDNHKQFKLEELPRNANLLPFVEKIEFNPHEFNIGDLFKMIENKNLLSKFGEIEIILDQIKSYYEIKEDLIIFILGLIPFLDYPIKVINAMKILEKFIKSNKNKSARRSILFFDSSVWEK